MKVSIATKLSANSDALEVVVVDRTAEPVLYACGHIDGRILRASEADGGEQLRAILAREVTAALQGLTGRRANIPVVMSRVLYGEDPDPRTIIAIDRREPITVTLAYHDGRPGTAQEPLTVPWSECRYA